MREQAARWASLSVDEIRWDIDDSGPTPGHKARCAERKKTVTAENHDRHVKPRDVGASPRGGLPVGSLHPATGTEDSIPRERYWAMDRTCFGIAVGDDGCRPETDKYRSADVVGSGGRTTRRDCILVGSTLGMYLWSRGGLGALVPGDYVTRRVSH